MRIVVFANGWLSHPVSVQPGDFVIAADGGARHCLAQGIQPNVVIGDLDSLSEEDLAVLRTGGAQIVQHPAHKDYTDLELALRYAQSLHADEILVLAALGERWDQTIANILLPSVLSSAPIRLIDGSQEIYFLHSGEHLEIIGRSGDTVSLIPLAGDAHKVTTHNLEYPLVEENLQFGSTRGISNVLLADHAVIHLGQGSLLCVHIRSEIR